MATHKYVVSMGADSSLPRDYFVNTLYFHHVDSGGTLPVDLPGLAGQILDAYQAMITAAATPVRELRCRVYDVGGAPPHPPLAEVVRNAGTFPATVYPREICLCLSFKNNGQPARRRRGRIYLPPALFTSGAGTVALRPNTTQQNRLIALADAFAAAGGADVSWRVRSQVDQDDYQVDVSWVDDEWDVQRRRGLRATGRVTKNTGS